MDRRLWEDVKSDCQFSIEIRGYGNVAYLDGTKCVVLRDDRSGNSWNPVYVYGRPFRLGRAIRDVRRITEPKGKWTKEFLNQYQMRLTKEQEINNPEAFVRTQLARGKTLGIGIQKWKQGIGYSAVLCFLDSDGSLWTYRYEQAQLLRYEYVLTGAGIFALLLR